MIGPQRGFGRTVRARRTASCLLNPWSCAYPDDGSPHMPGARVLALTGTLLGAAGSAIVVRPGPAG
jgi:hypothetical protein